MKQKMLLVSLVLMLFTWSINVNASCQTGGPSSSSCSISGGYNAIIVSEVHTVSVTCGAGYYACCNTNFLSAPTAHCIKNPYSR